MYDLYGRIKMSRESLQKLKLFYITSIFSIAFAMLGFTYNAWRMEVTEDNSNTRTAAFEVLLQLSEMEQIIYAAHYDKNSEEGNPRKIWVKVELIGDLSSLISPEVKMSTDELKLLWSRGWDVMKDDEEITHKLVGQIGKVRKDIKTVLNNLQ